VARSSTTPPLPWLTFSLTRPLEIERHDDGYLAYFPALPGCHTWGKTYEAAVKHAEEALIGFLEALQMNGEVVPVERPSAPVSLGLVVEMPTAV